ncbi:ABC transporter ATP-binding protein [Mycoplasmopsis hyopharyngis]|uniref:ABC transporter ATP-binding protein n=1 Tax=Mycoplasmopsis hyopharyngis TaxID=29558 RepID=UPI003873B2DF
MKSKVNRLKSFWKIYSFFGFKKLILITIIFLTVISAFLSNAISWLIGYGFDTFFKPETFNKDIFTTSKYWTFVSFIFVALALSQILNVISSKMTYKIILNFERKTRIELYKKLQKMPISYFENTKPGDLMLALTDDIQNLREALYPLFLDIVPTVFFFVAVTIIMYVYNPLLATIVIVLIPVIMFPIMLKIFKKMHNNFVFLQEGKGKLNGYIEEIIDAIPLINIHQQQEKIKEEFDKYNSSLTKPALTNVRYWNSIRPSIFFIKNIIIILVIVIGSVCIDKKIYVGGIQQLTFGILTSFTMYINTFVNKLMNVLEITEMIQKGAASVPRVEKIMELKPEIDQDKLTNLTIKQANVEFKNVNFSYLKESEKLTLENISFKINQGQMLALVGETGSGKTTISKLLSKFYIPNSGDILIDGQSIFDVSEHSWRENISIVSQDIQLFNGSIEDNLKCVNQDIDEQEFYEICKLTRIDEFIQNLPEKYETKISNNGNNFSEGQRQLFSLTRAIISKRKIIILDEATSNIDTITEKYIQEAISKIIKQSTIMVIAHRLNTIKNADKILLINKGKIIEQGNHKELMNLKGEYQKLYSIGYNQK